MPEYVSPGIYVEEVAISTKSINGVGTSTAGFVGMAEKGDQNKPTQITSWNQFVVNFGRYTDDQPYLAPAVFGFFANGGNCCFVVRVPNNAVDADYLGTASIQGQITGLRSFKELDEVSIVCIPGVTSGTVQRAMITHSESRKDRFCILDTAKDANMNTVLSQRKAVGSVRGYAALYYPWIKVAVETVDAAFGKVKRDVKFVPPIGYVAGVFARSDTERGVHKAPANEVIMGAIANGRLICIIGVAPVRPAEFVIFRIAQRAASAKDK